MNHNPKQTGISQTRISKRALRQALFKELKAEWDRANADDEAKIELFDAFIFMSALEGGTLPKELKDLIPSSLLQELVRDTYDAGREDVAALRRVVDWAAPSFSMKMDETTREEIAAYYIRACIRLRDRDELVQEKLQFFINKGYRAYYFLNGFYLRRRGNARDALVSFLEARRQGKYLKATIGELGECYKSLAMWPELRALIKEQGPRLDSNPDLLDIYAGMLIAEKDWSGADAVIRRLKAAPRSNGRAEARAATLIIRRDQNYSSASKLLTEALLMATDGKDNIRRMRALASAQSGDIKTAKEDILILKDRPNGTETVRRIEAIVMLMEGDSSKALDHVRNSPEASAQDRLMEARILDVMAADPHFPLGDRTAMKSEAHELRKRYAITDDLDDDISSFGSRLIRKM